MPTKNQCSAKTRTGKRCKNGGKYNGLCFTHKGYVEEVVPVEPTVHIPAKVPGYKPEQKQGPGWSAGAGWDDEQDSGDDTEPYVESEDDNNSDGMGSDTEPFVNSDDSDAEYGTTGSHGRAFEEKYGRKGNGEFGKRPDPYATVPIMTEGFAVESLIEQLTYVPNKVIMPEVYNIKPYSIKRVMVGVYSNVQDTNDIRDVIEDEGMPTQEGTHRQAYEFISKKHKASRGLYRSPKWSVKDCEKSSKYFWQTDPRAKQREDARPLCEQRNYRKISTARMVGETMNLEPDDMVCIWVVASGSPTKDKKLTYLKHNDGTNATSIVNKKRYNIQRLNMRNRQNIEIVAKRQFVMEDIPITFSGRDDSLELLNGINFNWDYHSSIDHPAHRQSRCAMCSGGGVSGESIWWSAIRVKSN